MPALDRYGAQPAIELIRQWLNHGYWSDLKDASKIELVDLVIVFKYFALIILLKNRLLAARFCNGIDWRK